MITSIDEVDTPIDKVVTSTEEVVTSTEEAAIQGASVLKVSLVMNVPWGSWDHSKGSFLSAPGAGNKTVWVEEKSSLLETEGLEVSLFAAPDGAVSAKSWAITPWDNSGTGDVTFILDMKGCYHAVNFNHALVTVGHVIKAFHIALTFAGEPELHVEHRGIVQLKILCGDIRRRRTWRRGVGRRRWRTRMRRRGRAWRTRMRRWGRAWRRQRRVWREYGHVISSARPPFSLDNLDVRKGSNERSGR